MKRSRYRLALIACATAVTVGAASGETPPEATPLRVATSGDYEPFSFHGPAGELTGFDVGVAWRLASDLGRPLQLVSFRWPDLIQRLDARTFDIAMSGVTVRPDRALHGTFSRPYTVTGAVAVVRRDRRRSLGRVTDLNRPGVRIAVNGGGHLEQVARARFGYASLTTVTDNTTLPELLRSGAVDAVISEQLEAGTWSATELSISEPFTHDRKAYLVSRDAGDLLRQVNDWLAAREADGWMNEQRRHWFGGHTWTPQQATFEALAGALDLRLQLMPAVGALKRREHLPIDDPAQEQRVVDRARTAAATAGLDPDSVGHLFRVQIDLAKELERAASKESTRTAGEPVDALEASLSDLRAAIGNASDAIITELPRTQSARPAPLRRSALDTAIRTGLGSPGLSAAMKTRLVDAIHQVHRRP